MGSTTDIYPSNTVLRSDPTLVEGIDYARRYRRHGVADDLDQRSSSTTIIAPHGGGIEPGTSELCLATAGYHPATMCVTPAGGPIYDYWMFEGLRTSGNGELHVTATHCDDDIAVALCAGACNVLAIHGCAYPRTGLSEQLQAVLVGGRNAAFRHVLMEELTTAGFQAIDATGVASLGGVSPNNIANRTLLGMGAQLELTAPLRSAMFLANTHAARKHSATDVFWRFVGAARAAIGRIEACQAAVLPVSQDGVTPPTR